jgi:hypothetical protein
MVRKLRLISLIATLILIFSIFGAAGVSAASTTETFDLHMELPNISRASNGDQVAVTGDGPFSVHPKSVNASGAFTHTDSHGNVLASGTWTATQLLTYQSYGCGVVVSEGVTLPPNFCGGMLKLRVLLTAGSQQLPGILTVFCIVGPKAPASHDEPDGEGIHLDVPGVANFNKIVSGMNIYIRTS